MFNLRKEIKLRKLDQILNEEIPVEKIKNDTTPEKPSEPWYNYSFEPLNNKVNFEIVEKEKPIESVSTGAKNRSTNRRFSNLLGGSYCSECGGPCGNHHHCR